MAKRRCVSIDFYHSEEFCELPLSAKHLYTYLLLNCDDDGVIINPKAVMRVCKSNLKQLQQLVEKNFLLCIDGVYIIRHWRVHNTIQPSKKIDSIYTEQLFKLYVNDHKEYCLLKE